MRVATTLRSLKVALALEEKATLGSKKFEFEKCVIVKQMFNYSRTVVL